MQRKRYRPNSKRNPWRNTWQDKTKTHINGRKVVAVLLLLLAIPAFCIGVSNGLLPCSADVYQYNLRSTQAVSQSGRFVSEEKVVALLGDFMNGKTDEFRLQEEVEYEPGEVFSQADEELMLQYRQLVRRFLWLGIGGFVLTFLTLLLLIVAREKEIHRLGMKVAGLSLLLALGFDLAAKLYAPLRAITYGRRIPFRLPPDDFLRELLGESFAKQMAVMEAMVCLVIYLLLLWLTWQVARRRKLFKGSYGEQQR